MLKYAFLASAMTLATPVLAQEAAPTAGVEQSTSTTAKKSKKARVEQPAPSGVTTTTNDSAPVEATAPGSVPVPEAESATPYTGATPDTGATPQPATPQAAGPQAAAGAATDQPTQVAAILDSEFPGYDKDRSGSLDKKEFASWMDALKARSDPAAKPDATWNAAAFKQADKDSSTSVTKEELAGFLNSAAPAA